MEIKTPLYDRHVACGGRIVPFAGYLLPVTISGFFPGTDFAAAERTREGGILMWLPIVFLAAMTLLFGLFAGSFVDTLLPFASTLIC